MYQVKHGLDGYTYLVFTDEDSVIDYLIDNKKHNCNIYCFGGYCNAVRAADIPKASEVMTWDI